MPAENAPSLTRGPLLVPGHTLVGKGRPYDENGDGLSWSSSPVGEGRAKCECGWLSPVLASVRDRKLYHYEHKRMVAMDTESEAQ